MFCPECHGQSKVSNSRPHKKRPEVWRRRHCLDCGSVWTSREFISPDNDIPLASGEQIHLGDIALAIAMLIPVSQSSRGKTALEIAQIVIEKLYTLSTPATKATLDNILYDALQHFDPVWAARYAIENNLLDPRVLKKSKIRPNDS